MASVFQGIEPRAVWYYFEQICSIPHPSKKKKKLQHGLWILQKKKNWTAKGMKSVIS